MLKTIDYKDEQLVILDQTLLPGSLEYKTLDSAKQVFDAIATLKVRGAPLIGVAAAYGVLVGVREYQNSDKIMNKLVEVCDYLKSARPTAVNLAWALDRMLETALAAKDPLSIYPTLTLEAQKIHDEDIESCRRIGEHTYSLIENLIHDNAVSILTHCNAGALATTGTGTATSIMYLLKERGVDVQVFACETRPLLQGARLTTLELSEADIPTTLITDNMVATVMAKGLVDFVIVGADRVAANGDVANKIGTLGISHLAKQYELPFFVACPISTVDKQTRSGNDIIIEERDGSEIITISDVVIAPLGIQTFNPAFDVTPSANISAIITEDGVLE